MKIVLAFDSYKGSLSAVDACAAAADGLGRIDPRPEVVQCPLSDGGEGFADALRLGGGGDVRTITVTGPLGEPVAASLVLLDDGRTAVIESSQANGLGLVAADKRNPGQTTTAGVGEMMLAAVAAGARRLVLGLGGSATNDGGIGMLATLGYRFLDADGAVLPAVGDSLAHIARIAGGSTLPADVEVIAACDVTNPLYGPSGAAYTFAPQKGASPADVARLDAGLQHFAEVTHAFLGHDVADQPGAGAAGGLGFALLAFLGAAFRPGAELAITLSRLFEHLRDADLCLTGEGQTDYQTAYGKLPAAVAAACAQAGVPCVCLSGALGQGWRALYDHHFTAIFSIAQRPQTLEEALAVTPEALADAAEGVGRLMGLRTKD